MKEVMYLLLSKKVQYSSRIVKDKIVKHKYIDFEPKISVLTNDDKVKMEIYNFINEYLSLVPMTSIPDYNIYLLFRNDRVNKFKFYFNKEKRRLEFVGVETNSKELLNTYNLKSRERLSKLSKI